MTGAIKFDIRTSMKTALKSAIQTALSRFGFKLTRRGFLNRFDAMDEVLLSLRQAGYRPPMIIDGGSNLGQWARLARGVYGEVTIHLIEPMPKCVELLEDLAKTDGNMIVHPVAATNYGVFELLFNLTGSDGTATSAQAALPGENFLDETTAGASIPDALPGSQIKNGTLLKLDLQGNEIPAL